jgi:23S rRNA (guanosine2251-2'-O)-methyltransferase
VRDRSDGERERLVVFGRRAVLDAIAEPEVEAIRAVASRELAPEFRRALTARCREAGVRLELGNARDVAALSQDPRHDQGVAAELRLRNLVRVEVFLQERTGRAARAPIRLVALDGLTNAQNVGMVVRSACALGLDGVVWPRTGVPFRSGLIVKASAATLYRCPILDCETLPEALGPLRAGGFELAALDAAGGERLDGYLPPHRVTLIVGSETRGLHPDVAALVDRRLRIPLSRGVESLNVAVAAALAFNHVMRSK